ncbi:hypothetical protein [Roseicitreum antarcticum]|uniref:Uncharacterized protein n=1 Tax=Roseicitreum antarcticum TaxID=564137 RepID=A0A1H2QU64_9RHOB|nr:hypothetical protein [Roseicitreum antarcticum]SDW10703.1 hypothetical protein SAMN04488238_101107 [Roseicitreum antarcticum]
MALPLVPLAGMALKYGAVALAGYALSRQITAGAVNQRHEDMLDEVPEGATVRQPADRGQVNASMRFRRIIRLGADGPGLDIDASALGRFRVKRV